MTFTSSEPSALQIASLPPEDIDILCEQPVELRVTCDQCHAVGPTAATEALAVGLALARGFVFQLREPMVTQHLPLAREDLEGGRIFCPRCCGEFFP